MVEDGVCVADNTLQSKDIENVDYSYNDVFI